jgi:hypothetical protein
MQQQLTETLFIYHMPNMIWESMKLKMHINCDDLFLSQSGLDFFEV